MSERYKVFASLFVLISWGCVVGTIIYYERKEGVPDCPSPVVCPEPCAELTPTQQQMDKTLKAWEEGRITLKECVDRLKSADERCNNASREEVRWSKQLFLSLKRCEEGE